MILSEAELRRVMIRKDREKSTRQARQRKYERAHLERRRLARRLIERRRSANKRLELANDTSLAYTTQETLVNPKTT